MEWKENNGDNRVYIPHTWRRPVRKKKVVEIEKIE